MLNDPSSPGGSAVPADRAAERDSPYAWWRLTVSLVISTFGTIGLWSSVVVLPALEVEFGVDRGGASFPYFATMISFAAGGIVMGRLTDRFGVMRPLLFASVMLGLGYILASQSQSMLQFTLAQAVLIGMLGGSVCFGPLVADVSHWFQRRRGIAVAIIASGNYLSGTVWPPLLQYAIDDMGWRDAHLGVGVIWIAIMVPLTFLLRRPSPIDDRPLVPPPSATGRAPVSPAAMQIILVVAAIACCIAMAMPQVHIVAYCVDLGYGSQLGAEMLAVMLGTGVISRLASGFIADKIGGVGTLILGSVLQCMALFLYLPFDGLAPLFVVSALFGLSQGGIVPSYALIIREYFPAREAGQRVSIVMMATVGGMALGGWMSGEIYDLTGSYQAAFLNGIAFNLLNMAIAGWLLWNRLRARPALA